ncbi:hypothetical protein SAMN05192560_0323 [Methylobacillus rhizosphaerae]|uniref:Uncharacterized protein n=1 Tax=Methylobacillus rhizosphaerae TaxID=551994 RepID=A0A238Y0W0_9PROT|nr:hypothetical protein [Methylobacillus rhizosphaerae]SNR64283.1 hypothetical protein SAMN05192560_0323 [Methylobacillus rhizosphaerae]
MKFIFIAAIVVIISGCTSVASPHFFNGNYYMAGDPSCVRLKAVSSERAICVDKEGNHTGSRYAMTDEQMRTYQLDLINQQSQIHSINQQLNDIGQSFQNSRQQILNQSQQYTMPQVQPISPYGASGTVTYRRVGNTIISSDGASCQVVGQNIICN